jgi:hypothetical protein
MMLNPDEANQRVHTLAVVGTTPTTSPVVTVCHGNNRLVDTAASETTTASTDIDILTTMVVSNPFSPLSSLPSRFATPDECRTARVSI